MSLQRYRGSGARSMTLRSASPFRSLAALLLIFAVLFGGAAEAIACDRDDSPTVQAAHSVDTTPASDDSDEKAQQHALCAHSHCHNVAPLDRGEATVKAQSAADTLHFALPSVSLNPADIALVKEPPRA